MLFNRGLLFLPMACMSFFGLGISTRSSLYVEPAIAAANKTTQMTIDDANGAPIEGAMVYSSDYGMDAENVSIAGPTDALGNISVPPWIGSILIVPKDGPLIFASVKAGVIQASAGADLTLHAVDELGKPLPGALISVFPTSNKRPLSTSVLGNNTLHLPDTLLPLLSGLTDSQGNVTFRNLPQGTRIRVTIRTQLNQPSVDFDGGIALNTASASTSQTIQVFRNGAISGRVYYRASGKPAAGAVVELMGPGYHNWMRDATTDRDGYYRFTGLFPAKYGVSMTDYKMLQPISPGSGEYVYTSQPTTKNWRWVNPDSVTWGAVGKGKTVSGIDFTLAKTAVIAGQVVGADGRPVFGAAVMVDFPDGSETGKYTDIDGHYRFRIAPCAFHLAWTPGDLFTKPEQVKSISLDEGETRMINLGPIENGQTRTAQKRAMAPDFTVQASGGKSIKLSDFRGKVVVLDFWFTGNDRDMLPPLSHTNAVLRRMGSGKVAALAIDTGTDDSSTAFDTFVSDHANLSTITFGRDTTDWHKTGQRRSCTLYRVDEWPIYFIIGPDGTLRKRMTGKSVTDEGLLTKEIEQALR